MGLLASYLSSNHIGATPAGYHHYLILHPGAAHGVGARAQAQVSHALP
jgi:hypothetical protein